MKFEEIFNEEGLYVADGFSKGTAIRIKKNEITGDLEARIAMHESENDINPSIHPLVVYDRLFQKDYRKVFTRKSLFK